MRSKADGGGRRVSCGSAVVGPRESDFFTFVWTMENGRQIRTQLAEKRLKLDSSSLDYEIAPTGPVPAPAVRISSLQCPAGISRLR